MSQSHQSVVARDDAIWLSHFSHEGTTCIDTNMKSEFDHYLVETERPDARKKSVLEWSDNKKKIAPYSFRASPAKRARYSKKEAHFIFLIDFALSIL